MQIAITGSDVVDEELRDYPIRTQRAMVRAMNRAIGSARTVGVREIAGDTGLKSGDVRKALSFREATNSAPEARLGASLRAIPLIKFSARGPEPSRGKGRGVSYRLKGSQGRHPHAFIATMKTGHRGVFVRKTKKRLAIKQLYGPSLGHVFRKFRELMIARAVESFDKNFAHEMKFAAAQGQSAGTD